MSFTCPSQSRSTFLRHRQTNRRGGNGTWWRATFELPESEKRVTLVVFRHFRWQARRKWTILSLCTCVKRGLFLVNRHEHTTKTTSGLRFSRFARVSLLEHLRYDISLMMQNTPITRRPRNYPPTPPQPTPLARDVHDEVDEMCTTTRSVFAPAA